MKFNEKKEFTKNQIFSQMEMFKPMLILIIAIIKIHDS